MIPKIIHYCWFGKNPKSDLIVRCINSWKLYCPDYQIIEWNEDNFDVNSCNYCKEAYENKKWAFVSDYARHLVLNTYGGIYLDTDVELLKNIDFLLSSNFIALESETSIASGLIMGCEKNNGFCKTMLESYNNDSFVSANGKLNTDITVCERTTSYFFKRGFERKNVRQIVDGFIIFPTDYFCPINPVTYECTITDQTVSIHHYGGSWCTPEQKDYLLLRSNYAKKHSKNVASALAFFKTKQKTKGSFVAFFLTIGQIWHFVFKKIKRKKSLNDYYFHTNL